MISAMPAVAIRRERSKSQERVRHPTRRGRFVEYYHKKISRMGSIRPPTRSYSTATTPDTELPPELLVEVDPYENSRCPRFRRMLRAVSLFHVGCVLIGGGLIVLFLSVGSIKSVDVTTMRGLGSFFVALGALLCFLGTVFFNNGGHRRPEETYSTHVLRLRSSESFGRYSMDPLSTPGLTLQAPLELSSGVHPAVPSDTRMTLPGLNSYLVVDIPDGCEADDHPTTPSPLRPTSADRMLPDGKDDEERSL